MVNADFDGDQINLFRVFGIDLGKRFARNMDPRLSMYVSRINGKINRNMLPAKDEIATFWSLNNV